MKKNLLKLISVMLCLTMILSASAVIGSADGESETVEIPDTKGNVAATFTVTMKDGQAQVETDSTKPYTVVVHQ